VVAVWVPRHLNTNADFLSHFSLTINRDFLDGRISDWAYQAHFRRHRGEEIVPSSPEDSFGLPGDLSGEGTTSFSSYPGGSSPVSSPPHAGELWFNQISPDSDFGPEGSLYRQTSPLVGSHRLPDGNDLGHGSQVPGSISFLCQSRDDTGGNNSPNLSYPDHTIRRRPRYSYLARARRINALGRDPSGPPSLLDHLGSEAQLLLDTPVSQQNSPQRPPHLYPVHNPGGPVRCEEHA
jgi:hypothetical protein